MAIATAGPSALWYLTRGSGAVTLVLLSATVVLGISNVNRVEAPGWPRFVVEGIHRNVSLLAIAMLAVHITTTVLDPFAAISVTNAVAPFSGSYRPLWLGLGALASDLLIAVALTSILRRRLGFRAWRNVHWLAYLSWPLAVFHGLGTGSDAKSFWLLALTAACVIAVVVAIWARAGYGWPARRGTRLGAIAASIGLPVVLVIWTAGGPLAPGWAQRAGTPAALLAHRTTATAVATGSSLPALPFTATVRGTVTDTRTGANGVEVNIALNTSNPSLAALDVRIYGTPLRDDGGVAMTSSAVSAGSASDPTRMAGAVTGLAGQQIGVRLTTPSGAAIDVAMALQIDAATGSVSGTLNATAG